MARALGLLDIVATSLERATRVLGGRLGDSTWLALHTFGLHRWREGYEVNLERGWRQYRGSRCAVCDTPWEGW